MDTENSILKLSDKNIKITSKTKKDKKFLILYIISIFHIILLIILLLLFSRKNNLLNETLSTSKKLLQIASENNNYKHNNKIVKDNDISEKIKLLKYLTNNDEMKYKGAENCLLNNPDEQFCIYHLLSPKKVVGKKRILLGPKRDGSYVLLDDFDKIKIAYSFGINKQIQLDTELANRGIDVFMYDQTINSLPYNHNKFHWKKIGIRGKNDTDNSLKTLEKILMENKHNQEDNMILKMDVSYWEWESLKDLSDSILKKFKYILIEYHFMKPETEGILYYNVLKKIHKYHQPFYFRCVKKYIIVQFGNNRVCKYIEVSYVIRENNLIKCNPNNLDFIVLSYF